MISERSINIRTDTCKKLLAFLADDVTQSLFILGEAGSGKTHTLFKALHCIDTPHLYIKYDQFFQQEPLPVKIFNRVPEVDEAASRSEAKSEFDWLLGQSELHYQCKRKLLAMLRAVDGNLVLVVDDVQWASVGDITMLPEYIPDPLPSNLKIVFIARSDDAYHYKHEAVCNKLAAMSSGFEVIELDALDNEDAFRFAEECALARQLDIPQGTMSQILSSAKSNPFYIQFFINVYGDDTGYFGADVAQRSILDFINTTLDQELRYILFVGAQIGFQFPYDLIQRYFAFSPRLLEQRIKRLTDLGIMQEADEEGFIGFSHDKIYEICKNLFLSKNLKEVNSSLFELLRKNEAVSLHDKPVKIALFYVRSGKGIQSIANVEPLFVEGLEYAIANFLSESSSEIALFLEREVFNRKRRTGLFPVALSKLMAQAFYQQGELAKSMAILEAAERREPDRMHRADLLLMQADIYFSNNDLKHTEVYTRRMLSLFGHPAFKNQIALKAYMAMQLVPLVSWFNSKDGLRRFETPCLDKAIQQYNKGLLKSASYYYSSDPFNSGLSLMLILKNSFRYGSTEETSVALQLFASVIVGGFFKDYKKAYYLSEYSFMIGSRCHSEYYHYRLIFTYDCFLSYFTNSISSTIAALDNSFDRCLTVGASDIASYAAHLATLHRMDAAASLHDSQHWLRAYSDRLAKHNLNSTRLWNQVLLQFIEDVSNSTTQPLMQGKHFNMRTLAKSDDKSLFYIAHHFRGLACMLRGRWKEAYNELRKAKKYHYFVIGIYIEYLTEFYLGICAARLPAARKFPANHIRKVEKHLGFLAKPKAYPNQTLVGKRCLLRGYIENLGGNSANAKALFEEAAELSAQNGHLLDRILALDALRRLDGSEIVSEEIVRCLIQWGATPDLVKK